MFNTVLFLTSKLIIKAISLLKTIKLAILYYSKY